MVLLAGAAGCSSTQSAEEFCADWSTRVTEANRTFELPTPVEYRDLAADAPDAVRSDLLAMADAEEALRSQAPSQTGDPAQQQRLDAALERVREYCGKGSAAPSASS